MIFFFLKRFPTTRRKRKKWKERNKEKGENRTKLELLQGELPMTSCSFWRFLSTMNFPPVFLSLSEHPLISEMYFIHLMNEAINFSFDQAFWFRINWRMVFLPPCESVCFVSSSSSPKVNLDGCNGIYRYNCCHSNKTFYQASLNLQSASFNP